MADTNTGAPTGGTAAADRVDALLTRLTTAEKVTLLTGSSNWTLHSLPVVGLESVVMSDGPVGVRGTRSIASDWSLLFPAPSALAATWDEKLAAGLGRLFALEARRKRVHVVLAPLVNLQRTPVAGRHFECYSEDPLLTMDIAAALVEALQGEGVGACVKHFVANDSETQRTTYLAEIDERTLREVYLAPFEHLVREVSPWVVMAAYNGVDDGVEASGSTEHHHLLTTVLKEEWGFDGVVVSDWLANTSVIPSALAGLDLAMPGPGGPWAESLLDAVVAGAVPESVLDDKVRRIVRLGARVGALDATPPITETAETGDRAETADFLRRLSAGASVVLRNESGALPLDAHGLSCLALIGPNAVAPFVQGGGSAVVHPPYVVTPEEGLRAALPDGVVLTVCRGGATTQYAPALDIASHCRTPSGEPGLMVEVLDDKDNVLDVSVTTDDLGFLRADDLPSAHAVRVSGSVLLDVAGRHRLEVATLGQFLVTVDGVVIDRGDLPAGPEVILDSSVNNPVGVATILEVSEPRLLVLEVRSRVIEAAAYGRFFRLALRHEQPGRTVDEEIADAVTAARAADVAVVVVGTNSEVESEGWDRENLDLPGRQDDLVRAVAGANPRTVVVVNAGAPVVLPWLDEPGIIAVVWWWLPGQEAGHSLADILLGVVEPSGRLPWTLPARLADVPVPHAVPIDGRVSYREGVDVGHRGWDRLGREPARPFGFGLGWTTWNYDWVLAGATPGGGVDVTVQVTNTGGRASREVVQVYLEPTLPDDERPVRWLVGHTVVDVAAGASVTAHAYLRPRSFEVWDVDSHRFITPDVGYLLHVGRSSRDLRITLPVVAPRPTTSTPRTSTDHEPHRSAQPANPIPAQGGTS